MSENYGQIENYRFKKDIGQGNFGKVKLGIFKPTGEKFAVKILNKKKIKEKMKNMEFHENDIIIRFNHINVIYVYQIIDEPENFYIIMEYCEKDLFDYIVEKDRLSEEEASIFFYQLINGVEYIHKIGIAHRDLKPENLLLTKDKILKIIDFGLSHEYNGDFLLETKCGSPSYASPEIISCKPYDGYKVDVWCCGIILYAMVCGYLPFEGDNNNELFKMILKCKPDYPPFLSDSCKKLLKNILRVDPKKRFNINDIKKSDFYLMGKKLCKIDYKSLEDELIRRGTFYSKTKNKNDNDKIDNNKNDNNENDNKNGNDVKILNQNEKSNNFKNRKLRILFDCDIKNIKNKDEIITKNNINETENYKELKENLFRKITRDSINLKYLKIPQNINHTTNENDIFSKAMQEKFDLFSPQKKTIALNLKSINLKKAVKTNEKKEDVNLSNRCDNLGDIQMYSNFTQTKNQSFDKNNTAGNENKIKLKFPNLENKRKIFLSLDKNNNNLLVNTNLIFQDINININNITHNNIIKNSDPNYQTKNKENLMTKYINKIKLTCSPKQKYIKLNNPNTVDKSKLCSPLRQKYLFTDNNRRKNDKENFYGYIQTCDSKKLRNSLNSPNNKNPKINTINALKNQYTIDKYGGLKRNNRLSDDEEEFFNIFGRNSNKNLCTSKYNRNINNKTIKNGRNFISILKQ